MITTKNARKGKHAKPVIHTEPVVMDFGTRKISNQNFSKMVAIPKTALMNCGNSDTTQVDVKLVQQNGEKFIKLTPICQTDKEKKENE